MGHDKLLVLDLDETLVHAREGELERAPQLRVGPYSVYHRPGLHAFMDHVLGRFEVAVWTASTLPYAYPVIASFIDPEVLSFIWDRRRCTHSFDTFTYEYVLRKDIRKLTRKGYAREKILFVDDTPANFARSYGNYVRITPYLGGPEDDELELLATYLDELGPVPNVRRLEKRGWQRRVRAQRPGNTS